MRARPARWTALCAASIALALTGAQHPTSDPEPRTVASVDFLGMTAFPTGFSVAGTEMGGLSGLAWDVRRGQYYALSDDPSSIDPARYYTLTIDVADGSLDAGDVAFTSVTTLLDDNGQPFPTNGIDPEGIALARQGQLYVASEGFPTADPAIDPFVRRFNLPGRPTASLEIPDAFLPAPGRGVRPNLGFESLATTPDGRTLVTATEAALVQDGPAADVGQASLARILEFQLAPRRPDAQYVYVVDPVAEAPEPADAFRVNGLVELLPLDDAGTFLALERSFSVGQGNTVRLHEISTRQATDVSHLDSLAGADFEPVDKRLLLDFADVGIEPDNLEALAFGPRLPDGRLPLIVASDNNFAGNQTTQFVALGLTID